MELIQIAAIQAINEKISLMISEQYEIHPILVDNSHYYDWKMRKARSNIFFFIAGADIQLAATYNLLLHF